jgi:heme exporter protein D
MFFDSLESMLNMGNHGKYVWSSYGITMAILLWNFISPIIVKHKIQQKSAIISNKTIKPN